MWCARENFRKKERKLNWNVWRRYVQQKLYDIFPINKEFQSNSSAPLNNFSLSTSYFYVRLPENFFIASPTATATHTPTYPPRKRLSTCAYPYIFIAMEFYLNERESEIENEKERNNNNNNNKQIQIPTNSKKKRNIRAESTPRVLYRRVFIHISSPSPTHRHRHRTSYSSSSFVAFYYWNIFLVNVHLILCVYVRVGYKMFFFRSLNPIKYTKRVLLKLRNQKRI